MGYGTRHESGEKEPKGAKSRDSTGEKRGSNSGPNSTKGMKGVSGESLPHAKSSDGGGEKSGRLVNGVAMGQFDDHGRSGGGKETGEFNMGRQEKTHYTHTRKSYQ